MGDESVPICDTCWGRLEVQDELGREVLRIARSGLQRPELQLKAWSEFYAKHAHWDHDGWLRVAVCRQRVGVMLKAKLYVDAERELRELREHITPGAGSLVDPDLAESYALALEGAGRTADAVRQLEAVLANSSERHPDEVMGTFLHYAQICRAHGMDLPDRFSKQLSGAIDGVGLPVPEDVRRTSLVDAIFLAHQRRLEAQDRYVAMLEQLEHQPKERRREVLESYARSEPVHLFKNMALRALNDD